MKLRQMVNIYLYSRYERLWHWLQSAIIIMLLVTGFEVHGTLSLLGFRSAVDTHNFVGLAWLILFAFFVFWLFTTGEYKQYIPTTRKMLAVVRYYSYGIFRGEPHPVPKRKEAKHNPLQRLGYLSLAALLLAFRGAWARAGSSPPRCCCRFRWPPDFCIGVTTPGPHGVWNGCPCRSSLSFTWPVPLPFYHL